MTDNFHSLANCIRFLSMDAVQRANCGHPGMPMGMADTATVLFSNFLKFDAAAPDWPIYGIAALSFVGWLFFSSADNAALHFVFASQWSPQYFALTPFMHASFIHVLFNTLALHFIGGQLLLPILKTRRFVQLFVLAALAGNVANSLLSASPAVGISAAVLGMLACALYSYGRVPVKLLLIHDLLRLRPFPLWTIATFLVALDIVGR